MLPGIYTSRFCGAWNRSKIRSINILSSGAKPVVVMSNLAIGGIRLFGIRNYCSLFGNRTIPAAKTMSHASPAVPDNNPVITVSERGVMA